MNLPQQQIINSSNQLNPKPFNYQLIKEFSQNEYFCAIAIYEDCSNLVAGCYSVIKMFKFNQGMIKLIQSLDENQDWIYSKLHEESKSFISGIQSGITIKIINGVYNKYQMDILIYQNVQQQILIQLSLEVLIKKLNFGQQRMNGCVDIQLLIILGMFMDQVQINIKQNCIMWHHQNRIKNGKQFQELQLNIKDTDYALLIIICSCTCLKTEQQITVF